MNCCIPETPPSTFASFKWCYSGAFSCLQCVFLTFLSCSSFKPSIYTDCSHVLQIKNAHVLHVEFHFWDIFWLKKNIHRHRFKKKKKQDRSSVPLILSFMSITASQCNATMFKVCYLIVILHYSNKIQLENAAGQRNPRRWLDSIWLLEF